MTFTKVISAIAISTALMTGVAAANPIETVTIAKDGIDVVPIKVKAGNNSFTTVQTSSHKFALKLYAKAKWSKKVRRAQVGSGNVDIFESMGNKWGAMYNNNSRTFLKHINPTISLSKLTYIGPNPVQACNAKLASHRNALTTGATTKVNVTFGFEVTNKTKITSNSSKHEKGTAMWYPVQVTCLPKSNGGFQAGS